MPIFCHNADHQLVHGQTAAQGPGGIRPICIFCNRPFVNNTRTGHYEEPDNEPLLSDFPLHRGSQSLFLPTVDPRELFLAVPVYGSRQSDLSSSSPSSRTSSCPYDSASSHDAANLTPPSILELHSPPEGSPFGAGNSNPVAPPIIVTACSPGPPRGKRFFCERGCPAQSFASEKDLKRHYESVQKHNPSPGAFTGFQCACGKPQKRRDLHKRHVKTCKRPWPQAFRCDCGHAETNNAEGWVAHLTACSPPKGRPPRASHP